MTSAWWLSVSIAAHVVSVHCGEVMQYKSRLLRHERIQRSDVTDASWLRKVQLDLVFYKQVPVDSLRGILYYMHFLMSNMGWACSAALFCRLKRADKAMIQIWKSASICSAANRTTALQLLAASWDISTPGSSRLSEAQEMMLSFSEHWYTQSHNKTWRKWRMLFMGISACASHPVSKKTHHGAMESWKRLTCFKGNFSWFLYLTNSLFCFSCTGDFKNKSRCWEGDIKNLSFCEIYSFLDLPAHKPKFSRNAFCEIFSHCNRWSSGADLGGLFSVETSGIALWKLKLTNYLGGLFEFPAVWDIFE